MAVKYLAIDGEKVSEQWLTLLHDAREAGVSFRVNEGHRTMARQTFFWNLYLAGKGNLAAKPSANAPHIRTGRFDHAIDFNGAAAVMAYGKKHGVRMALTVPGESWHVEANAADLEAYYQAHSFSAEIRRGSKDTASIRELQRLLVKAGSKGFSVNGKFDIRTRRAVRRFQAKHGMKVESIVTAHFWKRLRAQAAG